MVLRLCSIMCFCFFFFFKQKTPYDMRISDWSSDVCSSDLPLVDMIGPGHAPFLQQRRAVPLAHLLAEALRANLAHRQHDMRVRLGLPVLAHVPMYIHVRDHAAFDELLFDKIAGELDALLLVQLARNRELHL